ncbi:MULTISPECIES: TadE family type IV pilus minor pilin [Streptomyces]|uniref:Pilus assembly protein TadE n=1 Tax=Streptomyces rhizosphaericola TaxID=2564098 RepID=A0ABY2PGR8_9ACTN|nr:MULTISPECIES: TadE family type IV pilus minor pilin [Streptomyces]MYT90525.1 pilus assembly protein TadE [Streptomyces sp. SID8359]MYT96188.1 pilus assembly protein TadE [Streptomyces sp. SID8350]NGO82359.1 pilus assembly protein TadE [Streptomyces sp. 196(2019)]TGZ10142.1 pilus assembly protein TadE [Streptomyces rhizosphaericola]SCK49791.1 TadE-like protein [Streptomyces sp. AmelKG-D3]
MRSSEGGTGQGAVRRHSPAGAHGRRRAGDPGRFRSRDRGAVTAEAAVVIPVLVAFTMALLWALVAAADQIRCVDAARAGARAAARSEPEAAVLAAARDTAPRRARVEVGRAGDLWRVRVEAPTPGPAVLSLTLRAEAVALAEDTVGGVGHDVVDVDGP